MKKIEIFSFTDKILSDSFSYLEPRRDAEEWLKVGEQYECFLKSIFLGVVEVSAMRYVRFCKLNDVLSYLCYNADMQYLSAWLNWRFNHGMAHNPDAEFTHAVLSYVSRNIAAQEELLSAWWKEKKENEKQNAEIR